MCIINIYGQTILIGPVTGGSSYTGPTGVTGNTGPQGINGIATNTGATGNTDAIVQEIQDLPG